MSDAKRVTRTYSEEFKAEAVRRAMEPGAVISKLAEELGVHHTVIREWVMKEKGVKKKTAVKISAGALGEEESEPRKNDGEVAQLRAENARLRKDKETLKATLAMLIKDGA